MSDRYREVRGRLLSLAARAFSRRQASIGKVTVFVLVGGVFIMTASFLTFFQVRVPQAHADDVATSLTVLNTPPAWTVHAQESTESSTSTPTNAGSILSFIATATDSSNDNYWLLICSASSTPTPHIGAAPTCGGGIQWAVSSVTPSGSQATAATTTIATTPFNNESNAWYAYICDGNASGPACNTEIDQGSGTTVSPFVINHPPVFSAISNNSPQNPGGTLTWTATASDADTIRGGDTVQLTVCKANDYSTSTASCGAGGTWAQSTFSASNPATSTVISIPAQDKTYNAYVFIADQSKLVATSTFEASASNFVVNNVAPTVTAATISLVDPYTASTTTYLTPTTTEGLSGPFQVKFTVVDNNGCQNASSGNEDVSATTSIYRSGVGQAACQVSGNYNTNSCYPSSNPETQISCTQDAGSCSGPSDSDSTWTCTFHLWYNADPTVTGAKYFGQHWLAAVQVQDDNAALSSDTQASTGNDVDELLAFDVPQGSIGYGGLQPGQENDPLATTTSIVEEGNIGLDESLYGDTMCTTWTGPDTCDGVSDPGRTKTITVGNQEFATSSVAYAAATSLTSSSSPSSLGIHVPKTSSTSSPQTGSTYWGAKVPSSITVAGTYQGQNTIVGVASNSTYW